MRQTELDKSWIGKMKKAISLIELVFTIVIMGIVLMSFPLILSQTNSNIAFALKQEALLSAKTYMGTILSHDWDENSAMQKLAGGRAMVLDTTGSASSYSGYNLVANTTTRKGFVEGYGRRSMQINGTDLLSPSRKSSADDWGNSALDDIDDYDGTSQNLTVTADNLDYILDFTLSSTVSYMDDTINYTNGNLTYTLTNTGIAGITNVKMVEVKAENDNRDINILLRAYSSNIGEYDLLQRSHW